MQNLMIDQTENIENIASSFEIMEDNIALMNERITKFYMERKFNINFKECHVAISKNGGLIAICKKQGFLDIQKGTRLNDNVIVMFQNAKNIIYIPINWDNKKRWIITLDFTDEEKLYAIFNDGAIYKFDIVKKKCIEKITSQTLQKEHIDKAKFIKNGFIALTGYGSFYYIKNISNPVATLIFQMNSLLEFSNDVDFILIPSEKSRSGKIELLFCNEKGDGVIHIIQKPEGYNYNIEPIENTNDLTINGVSIIENDYVEKYILKEESDKINDFVITDINANEVKKESIGKICALAISPSYNQIAFYNKNNNNVYFYSSKFDKKKKIAKFEINEDFQKTEINEQKAILDFNNNYQFLFCGEDAIAISGQRFILLLNSLKKTIVYKIVEGRKMEAMQGGIFSKCISEIDGLRYITNDGVFFISRVTKEMFDTCYPFSDAPSKKLLNAYKSDLLKLANCDKEIREMSDDLPKAVENLQTTAANIYWTNDENEGSKKEIQMYLLKAAQHGKYFLEKEEFNFDKFVEICKEIRMVNSLRNDPNFPRFITYKEFHDMEPKSLIKKILGHTNFSLAFEIAQFIDYSTYKVYQNYASYVIKTLNDGCTVKEQIDTYEYLKNKLKNVKNISYIKLAKKAFKNNKNELGIKFLDQEKSIITKIPQYLELNKWDKALELSYETYDSNVISTTIDEILRFNTVDDLIKIVENKPKFFFAIVDYLKNNSPDFLEKYLNSEGNMEELLFLNLEKFFKSGTIEDRKKFTYLAKENEKNIVKNNINKKFYKLYLEELDNSLKFKKLCMDNERGIIKSNYIESFDNSVYDCYKLGIKDVQYNWIEKQNKDYGLSPKKMMLMRIRALANEGKMDIVDKMLKDSSLKKLNLTPLNVAEFYMEFNQNDKAVPFIKLMNDSDYFDYKVDMLMYMEKYADALEVVISGKSDRMIDFVNDILRRKPELQSYVKDLCQKYKVSLN